MGLRNFSQNLRGVLRHRGQAIFATPGAEVVQKCARSAALIKQQQKNIK
jgi:hypothetical protein